MSNVGEQIRKAIEEISHQDDSQHTPFHFATVVEVQGDTCTVEAHGAKWTGARLTSVQGADFRIIPAIGSTVLLADLSNGQFSGLAVLMYSAVERVELHGAEHTTAKADILRRQLEVMTERIDAIYEALQNSATGVQDGGATYKANIAARLSMQAEKEDFSDIEDDTILH